MKIRGVSLALADLEKKSRRGRRSHKKKIKKSFLCIKKPGAFAPGFFRENQAGVV
jgi:hypothetical protein